MEEIFEIKFTETLILQNPHVNWTTQLVDLNGIFKNNCKAYRAPVKPTKLA